MISNKAIKEQSYKITKKKTKRRKNKNIKIN